jgi:hypothetical protein
MIVIAKLEKPYKDSERINFIVNYNHQLGYEIKETDTGLEALAFDDDERKEQKAVEVRAERDRRIDAVRWRIERYQTQEAAGLETTDTAEQYKEILLYVQALRDVPEQEEFPENVTWPEMFEEESQQD